MYKDSIHSLAQLLCCYELASRFNLGLLPQVRSIDNRTFYQTKKAEKNRQQYREAVISASLHAIIFYLAICSSSFPWRIPSLSHGQKNENSKLLKRSSRNTNITDGIGESTAKKQGAERIRRSIIP